MLDDPRIPRSRPGALRRWRRAATSSSATTATTRTTAASWGTRAAAPRSRGPAGLLYWSWDFAGSWLSLLNPLTWIENLRPGDALGADGRAGALPAPAGGPRRPIDAAPGAARYPAAGFERRRPFKSVPRGGQRKRGLANDSPRAAEAPRARRNRARRRAACHAARRRGDPPRAVRIAHEIVERNEDLARLYLVGDPERRRPARAPARREPARDRRPRRCRSASSTPRSTATT